MQVFDVVQVMTSGNNGHNVYLYIYQEAFVKSKAGRAAAASIILFVILLVCTLIQRRIAKGRGKRLCIRKPIAPFSLAIG